MLAQAFPIFLYYQFQLCNKHALTITAVADNVDML